MTAPYTLPPQGPGRKPNPQPNPFDGLERPPQNPFDGLEAQSSRDLHAAILARNAKGQDEAKKQEDADNAPLIDRTINAIKGMGRALRDNPLRTVSDLALAPVKSLGTAVVAPSVGEARTSAALSKGGNSSGRPIDVSPYDAAHGGVTDEERRQAGVQSVANAMLPTLGAAGAPVAGAAYMPDDPLTGAAMGGLLHGATKLAGAATLALPERVVPPRIRLNETSARLKDSEFRAKIEDTTGRPTDETVPGYQSTALPSRTLNLNPRNPKGFQASANPFDGLENALGKQKPIETQSASAPLQEAADISNAATPDPALVAALPDMRIKRRIGGDPANVVPVGRQTAPLPIREPAPLVPEQFPEPAGPAGPPMPDGSAMGGLEGRIPKLKIQPTIPEGANATTAQAALDLKPSAFRGHSVDDLASAALDTQKAIEDAQAGIESSRQRGLVGEDAQADLENRGSSYSDESEATSKTAENALKVAKTRMAQIEREFTLRGVSGDQLAEKMQAAQELRAEREGMAQDEHLASATGDDPFGEQTPAPASSDVAAPEAPAQASADRGLIPVEGTGETKTRGLSAGVEQKAIESRLTTGLGDLPQYKTVSMADQASQASSLLASDPALARDIALGKADAPHGMLPESVFVAVENHAIANGDVGTIRELATGKLTSEATTMGQRIRALGERDPESPVAAIQSLVDARAKSTKGLAKATETEVAAAKAHIADKPITSASWTDFVNSMRC